MKQFFKKHWPIFLILALEILISLIFWHSLTLLGVVVSQFGTLMAWIIANRDNAVMEVSLITRKTATGYRTHPGGLGIAPTYEVVIENVGTKIPIYVKSYRFSSSGGLISLGNPGTPLPKGGFVIQIPVEGTPESQDFISIVITDENGSEYVREYRLPYNKENQEWGRPIMTKSNKTNK